MFFSLRGSKIVCKIYASLARRRFERFPSRIAYAGFFSRAAARTVQDDVDDSVEEMTKSYARELQQLGVVVFAASQETGFCGSGIHHEGQRAAELGELTQTLRACLREPQELPIKVLLGFFYW